MVRYAVSGAVQPAFAFGRCSPSRPIWWGPVALDLRHKGTVAASRIPFARGGPNSVRSLRREPGPNSGTRPNRPPGRPAGRCNERTNFPPRPDPVVRLDFGLVRNRATLQ